MQATSNRFDLHLNRRTIFAVPDAAGVRVTCRDGVVWITLDNDTRDIVLKAGQSFTGDGHTRVLVSAIEPSCISVTPPEEARQVAPAPRRRWFRAAPALAHAAA